MELPTRKFKTLIVKDEATAKKLEELLNNKYKMVTTATLGDKVMFLLTDK